MALLVPTLTWRLVDPHLTWGSDTAWANRDTRATWSVPVRITGTVRGELRPGFSAPIDLRFTNPNSRTVRMRRARVTIIRITAPHADAAHPCTRLDYEIRQMPRRILQIPGMRSIDLSGLGVPTRKWPTLAMRNRPVNQDGCKGARLTLGYRAPGV